MVRSTGEGDAAAKPPQVCGSCDARFAGLKGAFADNFATRGELGAALAVVIDGRVVADLWAGWADQAQTRPWQADTLVNVFSVGKAMVAVCALRLVERGELELDAPVARCWPEFAAAGKGQITLRALLSHRAGLPAIGRPLPSGAMYDWDLMTAALAAQEPWWEPGTAHGYHVTTFGFLVGELVRRLSGESIGAFLRRELAGPLGADVQVGIGGRDQARTAEFLFTEETVAGPDGGQSTPGSGAGCEPPRMVSRAYGNPPGATGIGTVNTPAWRAAQMPSSNAHATARGIARVYGALACDGAVDSVRVLQRETIEEATVEASAGVDLVLGRPSRFGLGFQLTQPERPLGPNAGSFGHFGVGGSLGFADPDARLAFGYTMNRGGPRWRSPRNRALIDALYEALEGG